MDRSPLTRSALMLLAALTGTPSAVAQPVPEVAAPVPHERRESAPRRANAPPDARPPPRAGPRPRPTVRSPVTLRAPARAPVTTLREEDLTRRRRVIPSAPQAIGGGPGTVQERSPRVVRRDPTIPRLTSLELEAVMADHEPALRRCYEAASRVHRGLQGEVELRFTLRPDGTVREATVTGLPEVAPCLTQRLLSQRFPPPADGELRFVHRMNLAPRPPPAPSTAGRP